MMQLREVGGYWLTEAEIAAARHLSARRCFAVQPNAWGSMAVMQTLALYRIASQCGRLFHVTPRCDRVSEAA